MVTVSERTTIINYYKLFDATLMLGLVLFHGRISKRLAVEKYLLEN